MADENLWRSTNLYGRRWRPDERDLAFYLALVADWPGVPAPPRLDAEVAVRNYAGGGHWSLPADTLDHWRCEVYCLPDGTPVGGLWGTVEGTVWTHLGQSILPAHRGRKLSMEAGRAGLNLFFASGGTEVLTAAIVPRLSARVDRAWSQAIPEFEGEVDGIAGRVRRLRITEAQHLARERERGA